ncbi:hypothetical protein KAR91_02215 [Candidatus Pacearchaeota archaeon]|nr:hypothetical protein [Candidatus Pacearchaeota archaeon]
MSENPNFPVLIPANTWTKIATAVVKGFYYKKAETGGYFQTYRLTGGVAPVNPGAGKVPEEGIGIFLDGKTSEEIGDSSPIDVYVYSLGSEGKLRVDV